jgi:hypothetical protein
MARFQESGSGLDIFLTRIHYLINSETPPAFSIHIYGYVRFAVMVFNFDQGKVTPAVFPHDFCSDGLFFFLIQVEMKPAAERGNKKIQQPCRLVGDG